MPEWDAEVTVDDLLVRSLLSEQFPELDARSARLLGEGWDNSGMGRRGSVGVPLSAASDRDPRSRARDLGAPAPRSVASCSHPRAPVRRHTERTLSMAVLRCTPSCRPRASGRRPRRRGSRRALGAELGRFLRALHDVELDVDLPVDPIRRADMPFRVAKTRDKLAALRDWTTPIKYAGSSRRRSDCHRARLVSSRTETSICGISSSTKDGSPG